MVGERGAVLPVVGGPLVGDAGADRRERRAAHSVSGSTSRSQVVS
jgi:hypothetical protein